jgi:hypothetical protein
LEKSRLRRFFQTAASLPPAKGVTFAGYLAAARRRVTFAAMPRVSAGAM